METEAAEPDPREATRAGGGADGPAPDAPDLEHDPTAVLALLEPDQIVEAKKEHFGLRRTSRGMRAVLWALRLYVLFMLAIVVVAVLRTLHAGHG